MAGSQEQQAADLAKKKKKKARVPQEIRVDLSCCKYEILRIVIKKLGWEEANDGDNKPWHLLWTDTSIGPERLMMLKQGQKVNHFVGMFQICRKKRLARNLCAMKKRFPAVYKFFPRAFILPTQLPRFLAIFNSPKPRTYILKPDNGCQGRGVVLVQSIAEVKLALKGFPEANFVAQKYLAKPMLLNGYKFDLRIYALIASCDPLKLFLYREGLVRFCTEKYEKPDQGNLKVSRMHLTNYSLNKYSSKFQFNESTEEVDRGSKWTLSALLRALAAKGVDVKRVEKDIKQMVVLTIVAIAPLLAHNYRSCLIEDDNGRSCFELLGLDVMLDDDCKPWLLEVNHSPSFSIDTPLDYMVKEALISDTLKLINIDPSGVSRSRLAHRRNSKNRLYNKEIVESGNLLGCGEIATQQNSEGTQAGSVSRLGNFGNFEKIYPSDDPDLQHFYKTCLVGAAEAFADSFDMKIKKEIAKVQEEKRQEELDKQAIEQKKLKAKDELRRKARELAKRMATTKKQSSDQIDSNGEVYNSEQQKTSNIPHSSGTLHSLAVQQGKASVNEELLQHQTTRVSPFHTLGHQHTVTYPIQTPDTFLITRGYIKNVTVPVSKSPISHRTEGETIYAQCATLLPSSLEKVKGRVVDWGCNFDGAFKQQLQATSWPVKSLHRFLQNASRSNNRSKR